MAENDMDGGQTDGTAQAANLGASGEDGVQQPSFDAAKLQTTLDALVGKIGELEARTNGLQSVKDKTISEVSGLKAKIAEYEQLKERFGADGAVEQLELKQDLSEIKAQLSKLGSTQVPSTDAGSAVSVAKAFENAGLDMKDPRVLVAMQNRYENSEKAELAAYRLKKALDSTPAPTPAQSAALQGESRKADVDTLTQEYITKMQAARGKPTEVKALMNQYKELGVPIGEVVFF